MEEAATAGMIGLGYVDREYVARQSLLVIALRHARHVAAQGNIEKA